MVFLCNHSSTNLSIIIFELEFILPNYYKSKFINLMKKQQRNCTVWQERRAQWWGRKFVADFDIFSLEWASRRVGLTYHSDHYHKQDTLIKENGHHSERWKKQNVIFFSTPTPPVQLTVTLQISLYYCLSPMKIGPRLLNWALTQGSSLGDTMLVNPRQS